MFMTLSFMLYAFIRQMNAQSMKLRVSDTTI